MFQKSSPPLESYSASYRSGGWRGGQGLMKHTVYFIDICTYVHNVLSHLAALSSLPNTAVYSVEHRHLRYSLENCLFRSITIRRQVYQL